MKLPTPAERERLALLAEECSEVVQIAMKILRHGYESYHPDDPDEDNRELLEKELGDVRFATRLMIEAKDINKGEIHSYAHAKGDSVAQYLHSQPDELVKKATEASL